MNKKIRTRTMAIADLRELDKKSQQKYYEGQFDIAQKMNDEMTKILKDFKIEYEKLWDREL